MLLACVLGHHISSGRYTTEEQEDIYKKENSALSEHTCLTNHVIGWDNSNNNNSNDNTALPPYQHFCLEAWHINSTHVSLNHDHGSLLPDAYLHLIR